MALTPANFRKLYRQFSDPGVFDDFVINTYINMAVSMLNASRWGGQLDYATGLFVAHHLTLKARDDLTSMAGGIPGAVSGPQSSKSVDKVSVSYDTKAVTAEHGGFWNLTVYGVRLYQMALRGHVERIGSGQGVRWRLASSR